MKMKKFLSLVIAFAMVLSLGAITAQADKIEEVPASVIEKTPADLVTDAAPSDNITERPTVDAAKLKAVLHEVAELMRSIGYPDGHAAVRVLSETWYIADGRAADPATRYYTDWTRQSYYLDPSAVNPPARLVASIPVAPTQRFMVAYEARRMLLAVYPANNPVVVAINDVLMAEAGLGSSESYYRGASAIYHFTVPEWYGDNAPSIAEQVEPIPPEPPVIKPVPSVAESTVADSADSVEAAPEVIADNVDPVGSTSEPAIVEAAPTGVTAPPHGYCEACALRHAVPTDHMGHYRNG